MTVQCYIFDIDGTLANGDHRLHHIVRQDGTKDWDAFFDACGADGEHGHIVQLASRLSEHAKLIFVSGRAERCRAQTVKWLEHRWFLDPKIYMRPDGDHRDDDILKIELLAKVRADGYEPIMAFDDRNRVVKAWRAVGIPCAQVAEGDF